MGELKEPTEKQKAEGAKYIEQMKALQNYAVELGKKRKQMKEFKAGDKVISPFYGTGVVVEVDLVDVKYPVLVRWDKPNLDEGRTSRYTLNGEIDKDNPNTDLDIVHIDGNATGDFKMEDRAHDDIKGLESAPEEFDKTNDTAVNPAHYRVEGIPEAIEIVRRLMTKEQLEGFLWGNIIKYAYRYGRKGDKEETAGKIEWYARNLKVQFILQKTKNGI